MTFVQKIITSIQEAEKNKVAFNTEETIAIIRAVKKVSTSKAVIDKALYLILLVEKKAEKIPELTSRETQVFHLIGLGLNSKEIAVILNISTETVSTHRKNIIKKLQLKGSGKLQKAAFQYTEKKMDS